MTAQRTTAPRQRCAPGPLAVALLSGALLLAACSSLEGLLNSGAGGRSQPDGGTVSGAPELVLYGSGVQRFQCSSDQRGTWWRFIEPRAELRDASGALVAEHGADFSFVAVDKSRLSATIESSRQVRRGQLREVTFAVRPVGQVKGLLSDFRHVRRDKAEGGLPTVECDRRNLGSLLSVRYTARYRFYR